MTDRELTELAAKAVGLTGEWEEESGGLVCGYVDHPLNIDGFYWRPLRNDGDALRLAVQLEFDITRCQELDDMSINYISVGNQCNFTAKEFEGDDAYAAMRRAIVRAAAALAKQS